jgi:acetyl-CoA synthetase
MQSYAAACATFDFAAAEHAAFGRKMSDGINVCVLCCDRHPQNRVGLRWIGRDFRMVERTFGELRSGAARFANLLAAHGIGPGDRVAGLLPRIPELFDVVLGTWRAGAVYQPLFTAFGPQAITPRLAGSGAKLIVTDTANLPKLADVPNCPPILVIGDGPLPQGATPLAPAMAAQSDSFTPVPRAPDDYFFMLFTSGTTGRAKGVGWSIRGIVALYLYGAQGLDIRPDDRFWNLADPGWSYGLAYAVCGPLMFGIATHMFEGAFTAESTWRILREHRITNLAGAPTAYRLLMAGGDGPAEGLRGQIRVISSAGEPLSPEVNRWAARVLGAPIGDHYGQTETGMTICNHHGLSHPHRPGSTGLAMPGWSLAILDDTLTPVPVNTPGVLAIDRTKSPLFSFAGYWQAETPNFQGDWFLTGDTFERDADGVFTFVGRADDIITSAGYRIGPFEVESALIEHPTVAEAAVVGRPDPERTEIVVAHVVLRDGHEGSNALTADLQSHVRTRLAAHAYPRVVVYRDALPKTPSGKTQRYILRQES